MKIKESLFYLPTSELERYGVMNLIYGSLTEKGIQTMVSTIQRWKDPDHLVAMDLGCGDGELMFHLQEHLQGSHWEGVEISEHRVAQQSRDVAIWQGDMLEESFRDYNLLHANNLCLDDAIAEQLECKIEREFTGLYISYRKATTLPFLQTAYLWHSEATSTSWNPAHTIYYYVLPEVE
jgi:hypothetical protein